MKWGEIEEDTECWLEAAHRECCPFSVTGWETEYKGYQIRRASNSLTRSETHRIGILGKLRTHLHCGKYNPELWPWPPPVLLDITPITMHRSYLRYTLHSLLTVPKRWLPSCSTHKQGSGNLRNLAMFCLQLMGSRFKPKSTRLQI